MKINLKKPYLKSLWALGTIAIIVLSAMPAKSFPKVGDMSDKAEHLLAYFAIGFVGMLAASNNKRRLLVAFLMIVLGAALEGVQYFLPTRQFELLDAVANTLGVAISYGAYQVYSLIKKK